MLKHVLDRNVAKIFVGLFSQCLQQKPEGEGGKYFQSLLHWLESLCNPATPPSVQEEMIYTLEAHSVKALLISSTQFRLHLNMGKKRLYSITVLNEGFLHHKDK